MCYNETKQSREGEGMVILKKRFDFIEEVILAATTVTVDPNSSYQQVQKIQSGRKTAGYQVVVIYKNGTTLEDVPKNSAFGWLVREGGWEVIPRTSEQGRKITKYLSLQW